MTRSKDGVVQMYSIVEENFKELTALTGFPREMWEQAALYDKSVGLPPSKAYVVPAKNDEVVLWRPAVAEVVTDGRFVIWPEIDEDYVNETLEMLPNRHYFFVDVYISTEVNN